MLADSLSYCREHKKMKVYAYCFMPSHIHIIFRSENDDPSGLIRDFKKFTSKKMIKAIEENPQESRKEWMLWMFEKTGKENPTITNKQFWQQHNKPIELWSENIIQQKINYIHNNPVKSGFVTNAVDWKYSSAKNYQEDDTILKIDNEGCFFGIDN